MRSKFPRHGHTDIKQHFVRELVLAGLRFSSSCLCAHTKWWLTPSPRACRHRLSSGTDTWWPWLAMSRFLFPLASYVTVLRGLTGILSADFARCVWIFFPRLIVYWYIYIQSSLDHLWFSIPFKVFFLLHYVWGFWVAFDFQFFLRFFVHNFFFFMFSRFFISPLVRPILSFKIPLLCMGKSDTAPTNKICRRVSSEQCPRTRSCHESEHLVSALLGQTYLWESLFPDPVREQPAISARRHRLVDSWSS